MKQLYTELRACQPAKRRWLCGDGTLLMQVCEESSLAIIAIIMLLAFVERSRTAAVVLCSRGGWLGARLGRAAATGHWV